MCRWCELQSGVKIPKISKVRTWICFSLQVCASFGLDLFLVASFYFAHCWHQSVLESIIAWFVYMIQMPSRISLSKDVPSIGCACFEGSGDFVFRQQVEHLGSLDHFPVASCVGWGTLLWPSHAVASSFCLQVRQAVPDELDGLVAVCFAPQEQKLWGGFPTCSGEGSAKRFRSKFAEKVQQRFQGRCQAKLPDGSGKFRVRSQVEDQMNLIDGLRKTGDAPGHKPRLLLHQKGQKCWFLASQNQEGGPPPFHILNFKIYT